MVIGFLAAMVVVEPDMGTALVLVGVGVVMLIASGMKPSHFMVLLGGLVMLAIVAVKMEPYRVSRLMAFQNPWKYYNGSGYQIVHSLVALGSGGAMGKGLAHGVQKLFYLPAGHTDFIFATIGEEMGLMGSLVVLGLFFVFVYRGHAIAHKTKDPFGMLLALGISAMVGIQAFLNIAVVTSSVPATGVPLPFMSYGGSSLILTLMAVGVLVNISKHPDPAEPVEGEKARDEDHPIGRGDGGAYLSGLEHGGSASEPRKRAAVSR
jgi:cell division protein FtsW